MAYLGEYLVELVQIHVAFEWVLVQGIVRGVNHTVDRNSTVVFDIGFGRVEMNVVGNMISGTYAIGKQEVLCDTSLMHRDHVFVTGNLMHRLFEPEIVAAPGIGFVADHQRCPLTV